MTTRTLAWLAILLWLITAIVVGVLFVRGHTEQEPDGRTVIMLDPPERDLVLAEMRGMLETVQQIVQGLLTNDVTLISDAARRSGMAGAADVNPKLMVKLPLEFKNLGMSVHRGFDELAQAAVDGAGRDALLQRLSDQLTACTGCHAGYRFPSNGDHR